MTATYQSANGTTERPVGKKKAHLVGAGIASLASAVYLIREGHMPGKHIHIFEESEALGGSLDAHRSAEKGYVMRGGRMFDAEAYMCTYDLLSSIPSLSNPQKPVKDDLFDFHKKIQNDSNCRLVEHGGKVDVSSPGFHWEDRRDLVKIMLHSEDSLGTRRIDECFAPAFVETNFWYMWCTTFAFQPWHSAGEFKRYLHRFLHEFPRINTLAGVYHTSYNHYDSIVVPLVKWLREQEVHFDMQCQVTSLDVSHQELKKSSNVFISYAMDNQRKLWWQKMTWCSSPLAR